MLTFKTPQELLIKKLLENEALAVICESINEALEKNFSLKGISKIVINHPTSLTYDDVALLKDVYKRFGWKVNTSNTYKKDENVYTYTFLLTEAS